MALPVGCSVRFVLDYIESHRSRYTHTYAAVTCDAGGTRALLSAPDLAVRACSTYVSRLSGSDLAEIRRTVAEAFPGAFSAASAEVSIPLVVRVAADRTPTVTIDGQPVGTAPYEGSLSAGTHVVEVGAPGCETFRRTIDAAPGGGDISFDIVLECTPAAPAHASPTVASESGGISVNIEVPSAEVRINGISIGMGPQTRDELAPGTYVVQVFAPGYQVFEQEVTVQAGLTTRVDVALAPQGGSSGSLPPR